MKKYVVNNFNEGEVVILDLGGWNVRMTFERVGNETAVLSFERTGKMITLRIVEIKEMIL